MINKLIISQILQCSNIIRNQIISDVEFLKNNNISTDSVSLIEGIKFKTSLLDQIVINLFENSKKMIELEDLDKNRWSVSLHNEVTPTGVKFTRSKNKTIYFGGFWAHNPDLDKVLQDFNFLCEKNKYPVDERKYWEKKIKVGLSFDEATKINEDLQKTPQFIIDLFLAELVNNGTHNNSILAPKEIIYYERLIGTHIQSKSIADYVNNELIEHIESLIKIDRKYAFSLLINISAHSVFTTVLNKYLQEDELNALIDKESQNLTPFSLISLIELAFLNNQATRMEALIEKLKNKETVHFKCQILLNYFIFVDAELAKSKIFKDKPVFYRRLASLAQASLLTKQLMSVISQDKFNIAEFSQQTGDQARFVFNSQYFIDLLTDHLVLPQNVTSESIYQNLLVRYLNNSLSYQKQENIEEEFKEYLKTIDDYINVKLINNHIRFLPNLLSGNILLATPPEQLIEEYHKSLNNDSFSISLYIQNLGVHLNYFTFENKYIEKIIQYLKENDYRLDEVEDRSILLTTLMHIANIACLSRNTELANTLIILNRFYLPYIDFNSNDNNGYVYQIVFMGFLAGSSCKDKCLWAEYIDRYFYEIINLLNLSEKNRDIIQSWLTQISLMEPMLYSKIGRTFALLNSLRE